MATKTVIVDLDCELLYETDGERVKFYAYLSNDDDIVPVDWHSDNQFMDIKLNLNFYKMIDSFVEDHRLWDREIITFIDKDKPLIDNVITQLKEALARLELVEYEEYVGEEDEDNK